MNTFMAKFATSGGFKNVCMIQASSLDAAVEIAQEIASEQDMVLYQVF